MNFLSTLLLALTSATAVLAQDNSFAEGLLAALRQADLTSLADIVESNPDLATALQQGDKTVLAPTNEAFAALGDNAPTGDDLLNIIRYHVVNSTLVQDDDNEDDDQNDRDSEFDVVIRSTLLTDNVNLPGDRSQVVVIGEFDGNDTYYVQEATRNVSFASSDDGPQYQNIRVQPITQVLTPPGDLATVAGQLGLSQLATLLGNANLVDQLSGIEGLTIFAPQNSALEGAQDAFSAASEEEQSNVLKNHVISNQVVYSTQLPEDDDNDDNDNRVTEATSASGNQLTFSKRDDGLFVTSGENTARIIRSDNIYNSGVIHIIDGVLLTTTSNTEEADAAASSASAAGASPTGNTGVDDDTDNDNNGNNNNNNNNNDNSEEDDNSSSALVWSSAAAGLTFVGGLALLI